MAPTRRSLLSALTSASVLGLAGCLGSGGAVDDPETGSPTSSPSPTSTPPPTETVDGTPESTPETPSTTASRSPTPTGELALDSVEFESGSGSCGQSSGATITESGRGVQVEGTVLTSTPCYVAKLESTAIRDDEARFVVTAEQDPDTEVCEQCLGEIPFSFTATFSGGKPAAAVVEITGMDSKTVRKDLSA